MKHLFLYVLPVLVFLATQLLGSVVVLAGGSLALALTVASGAAIGILCVMRPQRTVEPTTASPLWGLVAAFTGILGGDLLSEQLALPDLMETEFLALGHEPLGILALSVLGPVAEELAFRRGLVSSRRTIVWAALLFGVIHMNPAQIPFAAWMGLILGVVYWRTGSLLWPILIHIVNNSLVVVQMNVLGSEASTFTLTQWIGGTAVAWSLIVVCFATSLTLMWRLTRPLKAYDAGDKGL